MSELQTTIKINTAKLLFLLAPLVSSFAVTQDIFVPEVPQLVGIFHTNVAVVQWTLSIFMLAVGASIVLQWRITLDINLSITYFVMASLSLLGLFYLKMKS